MVLNMHDRGMTYKQIGKEIGRSAGVVQGLIGLARRIREHGFTSPYKKWLRKERFALMDRRASFLAAEDDFRPWLG